MRNIGITSYSNKAVEAELDENPPPATQTHNIYEQVDFKQDQSCGEEATINSEDDSKKLDVTSL